MPASKLRQARPQPASASPQGSEEETSRMSPGSSGRSVLVRLARLSLLSLSHSFHKQFSLLRKQVARSSNTHTLIQNWAISETS